MIAGVRSEGSIKKLSAGVPTLTGLDVTSTDPGFTSWLSKEMNTRSVTDVICTLGFSPTFIPSDDRELAAAVDYLGTLKLIRAAEAAKLSGRFVLVSSLGINATTESARLLNSSLGGVLLQKGRAEAALRASRLDWCIVRPGLLLKEVKQGNVLLGPEDRFIGDASRDREGLGNAVNCASPFLASSGAVCAATRGQVADVCVSALTGDPRVFSRRVVEVVARPDVSTPEEGRGYRTIG